MKITVLVLVLLLANTAAKAERYLCSYSWIGKSETHSTLVEVKGQKAITRDNLIDIDFLVAANSDAEMLIYKPFTKENSGEKYPVGVSVIALDKKTKAFVYSNAFAGGNQNNHATGKCEKLKQSEK